MTIEVATLITALNILYPADSDPVSEIDDHLRLLKTCLKNSFPKDLRNVSQTTGKRHQRITYDGTAFANRDPPSTTVRVGFTLVAGTFVAGTISSIISDSEAIASLGAPTLLTLTASTVRFRPFASLFTTGSSSGNYLQVELRRAGVAVAHFGLIKGGSQIDRSVLIPGFSDPEVTFAAAEQLTFHAKGQGSGDETVDLTLVFA